MLAGTELMQVVGPAGESCGESEWRSVCRQVKRQTSVLHEELRGVTGQTHLLQHSGPYSNKQPAAQWAAVTHITCSTVGHSQTHHLQVAGKGRAG